MPASEPMSACVGERGVDLLDARRAFCLDREVDDRTGRRRDAHCVAVQAAGELRDHESERLGGAGRRRHQVERGRAGASQILVRAVEQVLVGRVRMDRGHQPVADADRLVQDLGDWRQAVRRARRVRDDVVALGVVCVVVDAQHDVRVGGLVALRGRREDHLGCAGLEVLDGFGARAEASRGLDHHVDVVLLPRQFGRIAMRSGDDRVIAHHDAPVADRHAPREASVHRVERE